MGIIPMIFSKKLLLVTVTVVIVSIYYNDKILPLYDSVADKLMKLSVKKDSSHQSKERNIYTIEELSQFDGVNKEPLYLAILGSIYDVTQGRKHYEKGAPYHYFIGKDGSRSFITGNFGHESQPDHVLDLNCEQLFNLKNWRDTLKSRYVYKGKLIGRFYNNNGQATPYMKELRDKLKQCKVKEEQTESEKRRFPPCNAEWTSTDGSKVWCSKDSGGISRGWVGVPRQLYSPGEDQPRCACVDLEQDLSGLLLKEYDGCPKTSATCFLPETREESR